MNKKQFIFILLLLLTTGVQAQQISSKPPINNHTYNIWPLFNPNGNHIISNDGKYICYEDISKGGDAIMLCATDGQYKLELHGSGAVFTQDNTRLVYNSPDGLGILELGKEKAAYIKDAAEFTFPKGNMRTWLCYNLNGDWILRNLNSNKETKYAGAVATQFNDQGTQLVVQQPDALVLVDLNKGTRKVISRRTGINNLTFNALGNKLCFLTSEAEKTAIHYFRAGMDSAKTLVNAKTPGIAPRFILTNEEPKFSPDGERIFFRVADVPAVLHPDTDIITKGVDVWHYKDEFLQYFQLLEPAQKNRHYLSAISTNGTRVIPLENADSIKSSFNPDNKYAIVNNVLNYTESYWNKRRFRQYDLVSAIDGRRRTLAIDSSGCLSAPLLSPDEKFVVWFDPRKKNWISYEISTDIKRDITSEIKVPLNNIDGQSIVNSNFPYHCGGWLAGDKAIFIYDQFDIWQVDPLGKKKPFIFTAGIGRSRQTTLRITVPFDGNQRSFFPSQNVFQPGQQLLLAAFNQDNKYNGFYKKQLGSQGLPQFLCMDPCLYYFPEKLSAKVPVKAKNANVYLITKQTASDAPNLYVTTDFKAFRQLTNIQPQSDYNWMTSELVKWKMLDGEPGQGILYKPENFDPSKKYPVIFKYYEYFSHEVYLYKQPQSPKDGIDIAWYVSNGYLVFIPDIKYKGGHTAQSAVNSVVSAAKYLSTFPWVDKTKLGLQGHSFGGYETNCLIANSTIFACAQEGAGPSDQVSDALGLGGGNPLYMSEVFQANLRTTPWERPDIYMENSPIFRANKITTPLLIMHNTADDNVPFIQAAELFIALRRLQKPVWLLQYDGQRHNIDGKAAEDFNIRRQQFFAHYLKGAPMPIWMAEGIPAKYKGIKSGLALSGQ